MSEQDTIRALQLQMGINAKAMDKLRAANKKLRAELGYVQRNLENQEAVTVQYRDALKVCEAERNAWIDAFKTLANGNELP